MSQYALLGSDVSTSFSKVIHEHISKNQYDLISLKSEKDFLDFLKKDFNGINVTIPYKSIAAKSCNKLSPEAKETNTVNTVVKKNGLLYGYNTDIDGFKFLLTKNNISVASKKCVIFGTGATSRTVEYVFKKLGAKSIHFLSRNPDNKKSFSYSNTSILNEAQIIVNATPRGKFPRINESLLIDFKNTPKLEAYIDLIYNPTKTAHMQEAITHNVKTVVNGLSMLVYQALKSEELFLNTSFKNSDFLDAYLFAISKCSNIVLIGHPLSGKTTIGKELANSLNMKFVDTDELIIQKEKRPIAEIFSKDGEEYFRDVESGVLKNVINERGQVISVGGGMILRQSNINLIRPFSCIIALSRDVKLMNESELSSRPLSSDFNSLSRVIKTRKELYEINSDFNITNNSSVCDTVSKIREIL